VTIEIRDASLEARIRKQLQATGSSSVEEVLLRLLDTQEEQDRWLLENRQQINAKIRRGEGFQKISSTLTWLPHPCRRYTARRPENSEAARVGFHGPIAVVIHLKYNEAGVHLCLQTP
jgi:hypothetical protein